MNNIAKPDVAKPAAAALTPAAKAEEEIDLLALEKQVGACGNIQELQKLAGQTEINGLKATAKNCLFFSEAENCDYIFINTAEYG